MLITTYRYGFATSLGTSDLQARRETTGGPGESGHPEAPPPTFRLWPIRQKQFHSGLQ